MNADQVETLLADLRSWIATTPSEPILPDGEDVQDPVGLRTLLEQFVALRHEIHLQTRAVRAQQEQGERFLSELSAAREESTGPRGGGDGSGEEALRSLLRSLVDVADALAIGDRESRRVRDTLDPVLEKMSATPPAAPVSRRRRWWPWGRPADGPVSASDVGDVPTVEAAGRVREVLASLLTGYSMSMQRIERTLRQQGLEPVGSVGQTFDPEQMEVLEAVAASGRPAGEVVEVVRPGYRWRGRVFRYALVRVAKS